MNNYELYTNIKQMLENLGLSNQDYQTIIKIITNALNI